MKFQILARGLAALALVFVAGIAAAQFKTVAGKKASDIAIGPDGNVYIVSDEPVPGGFAIYQFNWKTGAWDRLDMAGVRIKAGARVLVVHGESGLNVLGMGTYPGAVRDAAMGGPSGDVYAVGTTKVHAGYEILKWARPPGKGQSARWEVVGGAGAIRIEVDPEGRPWIISEWHQIFRHDGKGWVTMPGAARDIAINSKGVVVIAGTDGMVYKWGGSAWQVVDRAAFASIAVDPEGRIWGAGDDKTIKALGVNLPSAIPGTAKLVLKNGEFLAVGDYLLAEDRSHYAIQQVDGNFCLYKGSGPSDSKGNIWCHHASGGATTGDFFALQQADGNFCTYRGKNPRDAKSNVWCQNAPGLPLTGTYYTVVLPQGHVCTYRGVPGGTKLGVWCSGMTAANTQKCVNRGCGIVDSGAGGELNRNRHDCSRLTTAAIKQHCEARNAAVPAAEAACAPFLGNKGHGACLDQKVPRPMNSFPFTWADYEQCRKSSLVPASCRDLFPTWMLFLSGGKGQLQSCQDAYRTSECDQRFRLYELCGATPGTSADTEYFKNPYMREECLAIARK
ncbi:tectonin domain-containing protein [Usitatibacter palustris]|uniref:Uncharacterized protein n=1 Tax=Usitatibacter palustris TaxID=2732487 RepID=A0A6M4HAU1_9PROT|nr:tectonin domain-containing protein [Usitatibacter palustris]QJR16245.1 hypothetical protein DSM104440_03074 [Usitatibacter palustris]